MMLINAIIRFPIVRRVHRYLDTYFSFPFPTFSLQCHVHPAYQLVVEKYRLLFILKQIMQIYAKHFLQLFFIPQARLRDPGLYRYHARGAKLPRVSSRV